MLLKFHTFLYLCINMQYSLILFKLIILSKLNKVDDSTIFTKRLFTFIKTSKINAEIAVIVTYFHLYQNYFCILFILNKKQKKFT